MARAVLIVLDSLGIGGAPDAGLYGDEGSNTLAHTAEACACGEANRPGLREGRLRLPHLARLGLGASCAVSVGTVPPGLEASDEPVASFGCAREVSKGKDTPSGHWELAGVPVPFEWGYFPDSTPSFPPELTRAFCAAAKVPGILGDCHASGTEIITALGEEHLRTGKPICYTSADSVFQIAAHEQGFGLDRLYAVCEAARPLVDRYRIGRVIARPFIGSNAADFARTGNRRDYSVPPPGRTVLDAATDAGREVISVGKIGDIFAHSGTGRVLKANGNEALFARILEGLTALGSGGLLVANLIDFDTLYGHRRDVAGYAAALERLDAALPQFMALLRPGDLAIITADHGCDPTWRGTDHTREQVPVLAFGPSIRPTSIGTRPTFADVGATLARHLDLPFETPGRPFPDPAGDGASLTLAGAVGDKSLAGVAKAT